LKLNQKHSTRLINVISNPFFLALPFAIILILFLPDASTKYKTELLSKEVVQKPGGVECFEDLNNDGFDERIIIFHNLVRGQAAIKVMNTNGSNYEQWNFNGKYVKLSNKHHIADLNNDGYKEIYVFYSHDDSVFCAGIQPYPNKKVLFDRKFITTIQKRNGLIDFTLRHQSAYDIDNDGFDELCFIIVAGFSRQPRQFFYYDLQLDTIFAGPVTGINYCDLEVADLNDDGEIEIYMGGSTAANIPDSLNIPYNDYSSWFVGLNNKLEFMFEPIRSDGYPSSVLTESYTNNDGEKMLVVYHYTASSLSNKIVFYDENLNEVYDADIDISGKDYTKRATYVKRTIVNDEPYLLIGLLNEKLLFINDKGEKLEIDMRSDIANLFLMEDINGDGKTEYVFGTFSREELIIFDHNFNNPVLVPSHRKPMTDLPTEIGVIEIGNESRLLYILAEDHLYKYTYGINTSYYLKYPIWIVIYLIFVFIIWLSQRLQKYQVARNRKVQDTINSLQMKTIKSQMDPHFMFNVLNGLAHNVAKGNTEEAHDQILRFSLLLRSLMKRVDRIDISLNDEIQFVNSYLELEKFRFKDDFIFDIEVGKDADMNVRIPRMLIQLIVENSIKHGLRNKEGVKKLKINLRKFENNTKIVVEDNGVGRKEALIKTRETGQGLKLINDMIRLNRKLGGNDIQVTYIDLLNDVGKAMGTIVEVII